MVCPKCSSENVQTQVVNEAELKNKHHGCLWWLIIGWWWVPIKWICFFWIALIVRIFVGKKKKIVNKQKTMFVCQACGHSWDK